MDENLDQETNTESLEENKETTPTLPLQIPFTPYNHTTATVPLKEYASAFGSKIGGPPPKEIGFSEGLQANWENLNYTYQAANAGIDMVHGALLNYKDENFNPLEHTDKFLNIQDQYMPALLAAQNEPQMDFILKKINHEQWLDETIKNGSWLQFLAGGALAIPTDLLSYVPVIGQVKYASLGKTVFTRALKNIPGGLAYGVGSAGAEQLNKINGNMHDFLQDSVIRSVFATSLFALPGVATNILDKADLWKLQSYVADSVKGIGYRLKVGEKGEYKGLEAYDMTPNRSVGADAVRLAQDKADSSFDKVGFFKIPYVGTAAEKLMSNRFIGSTAMSMLTSPFKTVASVVDLAYDHGIITKGIAEGREKPITFFSLLAKTHAHIAAEQTQYNALYFERNGIKTDSYIKQSALEAGNYLKQKTLEKLQSQIGNRPYISHEQFDEEVQTVLRNEVPHENAAVNEAAAMLRTSMDRYYSDFREAYKLPADWLPPKQARGYLMRVYDLNYLNNNLYGAGGWVPVIANELRNQDRTIIARMQPINDLEAQIKDFKSAHNKAFEELGRQQLQLRPTSDFSFPHETGVSIRNYLGEIPKGSKKNRGKANRETPLVSYKDILEPYNNMNTQLKRMHEELQNELRSNPDFSLLVENWNHLSADESHELTAILKPRNELQQQIDEQKSFISKLKIKKSSKLETAKKQQTVEKAAPHAEEHIKQTGNIVAEESKLFDMQKQMNEENDKLQSMAYNGKMNSRFYFKPKDSHTFQFKDPNERLKFRKTYHEQEGRIASEADAHYFREEQAKAYYYTIKNQTAEDTINQIMGGFTGNKTENHLKHRKINIPDEVLYQYKFMSKDLMSKVANYKTWLARRTHLKNVYQNVTTEGGFEGIGHDLQQEFEFAHNKLNEDKASIQEKLNAENISAKEKVTLEKGLEQIEKEIKTNGKKFDIGKDQIQFAYEKMMGISRLGNKARSVLHGIKSFNVGANLGFLPITMITDLFSNPLQHGFIPFIQSGIYPAIESMAGIIKTHDSEALRNTAGAINLGLHHVMTKTASRQVENSTNPYLSLGRIPAALNKMAHLASNLSGANITDNGLQYLTSAVAQSNVIMHMKAFKAGKLAKGDKLWLLKSGLNPEKDADRILAAFKKDGGGTNRLGGYQSNFWEWEDKEISNKVADATFRATHATIISANALDSPIWMDENGAIGLFGPIIKGFKGWAFASMNRYLIPSLQAPDAQRLIGLANMMGAAALIGPTRRMAKGQEPYADKNGKPMTTSQIVAEILFDTPMFAWISTDLQDMNLLAGGHLLGDLKNNKYDGRTRIGLLGPTAGNFNKLWNFTDAMASGTMNETDAMAMAGMIPVVNSAHGFNIAQHFVKALNLPKYPPK